ncbi:DUF7019 family protein [Streptomyces sp. NPDC102270]|uniref:DUF7019 family protein n=1 Tax=Streptomyces sp. NPDC102270 TaxID=3366150 RepID=UPI003807731D
MSSAHPPTRGTRRSTRPPSRRRSSTHCGATPTSATRHAVGLLRGPAQTVEFVAQKLLQGPSPLGSPLYVALVG